MVSDPESAHILAVTEMRDLENNEMVFKCVEKCMDTEDLYSLNRQTMPIKQRLKLDEEEKKCVANCGGKWDELYKREVTRLNQRAQGEHAMNMFMQHQQALAQGGAPPM